MRPLSGCTRNSKRYGGSVVSIHRYLEEIESVLTTFEPAQRNEVIRWLTRRLAETGRASLLAGARAPTRQLSDVLDRAIRGEPVEPPSDEELAPVYEYFEEATEGEFISWAENFAGAVVSALYHLEDTGLIPTVSLCKQLLRVAASSEDLDSDISSDALLAREFEQQVAGLRALRNGTSPTVSRVGR